MNDRLVAFVLLALCVLALGASAGALSTDLFPDASDGGGSGGDGGDLSDGPSTIGGEPLPVSVAPWLVSLVVLAAVALAVPSLLALRGRHVLAGLAVLAVFVVLVGFLVLFGDPSDVRLPESPNEQTPDGTNDPGNDTTPDDAAADDSPLPSLLPLGVVGLVLVVAVVLAHQVSGGGTLGSLALDSSDEGDEAADEDGDDARALGRAAGRAADELAGGVEPDRSNAVYEAWLEMTTALDDPDPETATPGEFADAAVAAGMDSGEVREITALFEAVRYGDESPTDDVEDRAIGALRRIEARHATDVDANGERPENSADGETDEPGGGDE